MNNWLSDNYIEIIGAVTGIIYVFLEIRQTIWLWPLGLITSAAYVWIFFSGKLYADMSLQAYYIIISLLGWYWWVRGAERRAQGRELIAESGEKGVRGKEQGVGRIEETEKGRKGGGGSNRLVVTRLKFKTALILSLTFVVLYAVMYIILSRLTDSPVPGWDAFLTSLSIIATWMLARKIYEHWYLWVVVNFVSLILYFSRGLYPTVILYAVYLGMSFVGLKAWKKTIKQKVHNFTEN
jgi:nicotinamide mononucleotide transporter